MIKKRLFDVNKAEENVNGQSDVQEDFWISEISFQILKYTLQKQKC